MESKEYYKAKAKFVDLLERVPDEYLCDEIQKYIDLVSDQASLMSEADCFRKRIQAIKNNTSYVI